MLARLLLSMSLHQRCMQPTAPLSRPTRAVQLPVLSQIAREEGAAALWRGWQPRVLFHAPSGAAAWAWRRVWGVGCACIPAA